jgi:hypothetical protein
MEARVKVSPQIPGNRSVSAPFSRTPGRPLRSDAGDGRLADFNGLAPQVRAGYSGGRGESRIGTN